MPKDFLKIQSCSSKELLDNCILSLFSVSNSRDDSRLSLIRIACRLIIIYCDSVYYKKHNWLLILDCVKDLLRLHINLSYKNYDTEI